MNIARSSAKIFLVKIFGTIVNTIGVVFFARELGAHQIGIFFLFQALLGMLAIPADFGIRSGLIKRLSEGDHPGRLLSGAILLKSLPLVVIVSCILILKDYINNYLGGELAILLAVAIVLQEFTLLAKSVLEGELRVGATALPSFSKEIVFVSLGYILVILGYGVYSLIYGLLIGLFVMFLWSCYRCSISLKRPSQPQIYSLVDYSKYAAISSVGGYLYNWLDIVVIGYFLTQSHVGAYEISWRITGPVLLLSSAIGITIFPQVSKWDAEDSTEKIENIITKALTPSLAIVIPAFFGILLYSFEILGVVFGQEYTIAWLVLIILMGDKVFQAIQVIIGRSLQAIDRPDLAARATLISLVINIVLNIVFVLKYGIVGAAAATVIASVLNDFLHMYYLSRFITIRFPWGEIIWCILSSIVMACVLLIVGSIITIETLPTLIGIVILGAIIYFTLIMASPTIRIRTADQLDNVVPFRQ